MTSVLRLALCLAVLAVSSAWAGPFSVTSVETSGTTFGTGTSSATAVERLRITQGGLVGISNTSPIAKLDVVGTISASDAIQVSGSGLTCASSINGAMRWNATSDTLQICTGSGWKSLASSTTAGGAVTISSTGIAAWVTFAGSNGAIGGATNIASVTRNSTGRYTITFSYPFADTNYGVTGSGSASGSGDGDWLAIDVGAGGKTSSTVKIVTYASGGASTQDWGSVTIALYSSSGANNSASIIAQTISTTTVSATNVSGTLIQVGPSSATCASSISGSIRYGTASNTLQICTGTGWVSLASGSAGGGATPGGSDQQVQFTTAAARSAAMPTTPGTRPPTF